MSNPHGYTVGWICAIATEYVAAQAFLDEKHEGPESVSTNDNNDYTLGKIGKHNVVIAVLPHGEYGISSAASVARDMLHSFPNVRIGLMVGIGGGAPSPKHDIRLGDVVVSASGNGKGGVFQYDFGKAIQGQDFQETGFLNQPPSILRAAVNGLMAQYEGEGHQLEESINTIFEKRPRLRTKYSRPAQSTDRLYQPKVLHPPNDESSCATACGNNPSTLVVRPERTEYEDNPSIHHGLIASSNMLMKDALIRDALAVKKDVLCFEMEAAGLMNHFPCLVIRGICDYSDTHKNKEWQGYAAMTAAAYAKDLLCRIVPTQVEAEKKISEMISGLHDEVSATSRKADTIINHQRTQEAKDILDWITPVDYGPQQSDNLGRRQPGTGQWLLDTVQFRTWRDTRSQTLFCPGIPGAGKTILTSIVIENLETLYQSDRNIGIAYVYCGFQRQDKQTAEELLASLLKQLAQSLPTLPESVKSLCDKHKGKRSRPSLDEISNTLQSIAKLYSKVFVLIDGLDECRASDGSLTAFLEKVFSLQVNIFATSRFIPNITELFEDSITLEIRATDEDVQTYVRNQMSRLPTAVRKSPELQEEVIGAIADSVDGMFLLAQLHLKSLIGKTSVKVVRSALAKLPSGSDAYDQAYETAMERIEKQVPEHRGLAKQTLSWITCSKRPLTIIELQHALAVEVGMTIFDKDALPEIEDMLLVCVGLVTIDEQSDIIRLVHYTTQQYFDKSRGKWFANAEANITTTCATYLSFKVFETGYCDTDEEFEERMRLNPFYDYSAHYWGDHARDTPTRCQEVIDFLESDTKVESSSQALMAAKKNRRGSEYSRQVPKQIKGLHLAAYFGVRELVVETLQHGKSVDLRDSDGRTPLSYAAQNGHADVVKLLLDKGADLKLKDTTGRPRRTALWWAIERRQGIVVSLLVDHGVDLISECWDDWTPLQLAVMNGGVEVVARLLEKGAPLESRGRRGQKPLELAASFRHEAVVRLLLEKGADLESKGIGVFEGQTPLSLAAEGGHEDMVRLLLQKGAKVNSKATGYWEGRTPLSFAAYYGHEAVVRLLLERGADTEAEDKQGRTPLFIAVENGRRDVAWLLSSRGSGLGSAAREYFGSRRGGPFGWTGSDVQWGVVTLLADSGYGKR